MKQLYKRMIGWLCVTAMLVLMLPVSAFADIPITSGVCGDLTWAMDDQGTLTFRGNGEIPDYGFTHVEETSCRLTLAPWGTLPFTRLIIEEGVTGIGDFAFSGCTSLTEVIIPDSVASLGAACFSDCTSLIHITLPDTVLELGDSDFVNTAYYNDPSNWIDNILYIGKHAIRAKAPSNAYALSILPGTITIANRAFGGHPYMTGITIPNSVQRIGNDAFYNCQSLTSLTIPEGVTSIGVNAFGYCNHLTSLSLPNSITDIAEWAFSDCSALTSITIPHGVTELKSHVFSGCRSLREIVIPKSVTHIAPNAFEFGSEYTTIIGAPGTYAETYARQNAFSFSTLSFTLGNTDKQDDITVSDALLTLQAATDKIDLTVDQVCAADVNDDNTVTVNDALLILQYATKTITEFPATV